MKNFKNRILSLVVIISLCLSINSLSAFAADKSNTENNSITNIELSNNLSTTRATSPAELNLEFSGLVQGAYSGNVYTFTVPATGQYKILMSTAFAAGECEVTLSITENDNYFTSFTSSGGRIPAKIVTFKAGETYKISLFAHNDKAYYAYSGMIYSF